jgi:PAS domain S-box-containing protein
MNRVDESPGESMPVEVELFRLAGIVKFSEDAIIGADLDGIIFSWNQGAERIYGYTEQQIKGQHLLTLIPPDRRDELKVVLQKINRGEHFQGFETRRIRRDGTVIHLSTTISPARDAEGKITGASLFTRDITKLKEVEETLAKERTLLQIVLDNLTARVYAKDAAGRYILDNPAHREFLGVVSPEEVLGRTVFDFFPAEIAQQYHADDIEIIRSGNALLNREEETVTRAGEKRWLSTTKVPYRNSKGEIVGLVCMSRDITDRKLASTR